MYLLSGIFFTVCILFYGTGCFRKRQIIRKIYHMDFCEKCSLLNTLIRPFGFEYLPKADIFTSSLTAWQRKFGYHASFDRAALHFNIVFDCEPVYFDYNGRTWLIEVWKGQYGINTGCEIGIYHADAILSPEQYGNTQFQCASDEELLPLQMELYHCGRRLFFHEQIHWWLTGFCMGKYCEPEDLKMKVSITFPEEEMMAGFQKALSKAGCTKSCVCGLTVSFFFSAPCTFSGGLFHQLFCRMAQWRNRLLCRLFCRITWPFSCTLDQMLCLYYFLPFAFRRIIRFQKCRHPKAWRHL